MNLLKALIVGLLASITSYGQELVWENSIDTLRSDWFMKEPSLSFQIQSAFVSVGSGSIIQGADVSSGKIAIGIPRRSPDSTTGSVWSVTQKWVDGDDGWEVLAAGTTSGPNARWKFLLYDESKTLLQGDGYASLAFDGDATYLVAPYKGYKVYKLRDGLRPASAQGLPKTGAGKPQGMIFFGRGAPGFQFESELFNSSGAVQR